MRRPRLLVSLLPVCVAVLFAALASAQSKAVGGPEKAGDVKHGEYLVSFGGCSDCHTPKIMGPKGPVPNPAKLLSGHQAGTKLPDLPSGLFSPGKWGGITNTDMTAWVGAWGTSFAANLTPDPATGIGAWTDATFMRAMRTGKHMGSGRDILPPMPWFGLAPLKDQDLKDIFAYLHSIKAIANKVPDPIPPKQ
jgi:mono/diheme cytochrome c family protein